MDAILRPVASGSSPLRPGRAAIAARWEAARSEAADLAKAAIEEKLIGQDISEEALSQARYHAELAGVAGDIHFQRRNFSELSSKRQYGLFARQSTLCPQGGHRSGGQCALPLDARHSSASAHLVAWDSNGLSGF